MAAALSLVCALALAGQSPVGGSGVAQEPGEAPEEPEGGAGVTPIEIVPRVELRQSNVRLRSGAAVHDLIAEIDVQLMKRLLLQYYAPYRTLATPTGSTSGGGDIQVQALAILDSTPSRLLALLLGTVLNTATQPELGAGKQQLIVGGGAAFKPRRFWIAYALAQEQFAVAGSSSRADINQLEGRLGTVLFGKQYNWLKLDLDTVVDFAGGTGRLFGTLEVGSLLIGRVGMFVRVGTQLVGPRQVDYSLAGGLRYLFRLDRAKAKPSP